MAGGNGDLLGFDNLSASDPADNLTLLRGRTQTSNLDNQVTADGVNGAIYGYDLDGTTTAALGVTLQYDDADHLVAYDYPAAGVHITMGCRPDGLRAWKQVNGARTYFYYDGEQLTAEVKQGPPYGDYYVYRLFGWGAAGLEQMLYDDPASGLSCGYLFDPLGNLVSRVSGLAQDLVGYDAFGGLVGDWDFSGNGVWFSAGDDPVGWGGQWGAYTDIPGFAGLRDWPEQSGLILLTHRYYNPNTGKFLTCDPIGYEGGVNIYAYTRNNPVMRNDPSGYDFLGGDFAWWNGAGMAIWNDLSPMIPGYHLFNVLGVLDRNRYKVDPSDRQWRGYDDMHNYLGIIAISSMHPDFDVYFADRNLDFQNKPISKSPCFVAGTPVQVLAAEEMPAATANYNGPRNLDTENGENKLD